MDRDIVGFYGAGMMGGGMVRCLLKAGHPVRVTPNRSAAALAPLVEAGAEQVGSVEAVAQGAAVIVTCLPDADAMRALADRIAPLLGQGTLWIDTTTSDPEVTKDLAQRLAAQGVTLADAPVTGSPAQADAGGLASLVGCAEADFARIEAVVSRWSVSVRRFGDVGAGHSAKLLNNAVTQGTMVLLAASYGLARRAGVDWQALYDVMQVGAARSGTLEKAVGPALQGNFDGSRFSIANAEKDLRYGVTMMERLGEDCTILRAAQAQLAALKAAGHGDAFVSRQLELPISASKI
ncbi:NAD(P)-dependent oxidoreductase [Szabonella alba]|uniref:NAD(P)-dependent oxidoreductase n=1 Tax=Szabonella alba TaxID=2804194 RepID=A0A8K0Y089_9RHOB|nr:NAD(P)-dependent oxidoreductase [Szabonella alba]MBL4916577.1 NAD(P)-dependent oxidoreductase [Szabonella alba]